MIKNDKLDKVKLAIKHVDSEKRIIEVGNIKIGKDFTVIAGPCSVESEKQLMDTAVKLKACSVNILRGGVYKPRTSPYDFQGLGEEGLKLLSSVGKQMDMPVITEIMDVRNMDLVCQYADIIQVGARNMQNFTLLKELGICNKPVLLKRGLSATILEWLNAAEYILDGGNRDVILCERGIRSFETFIRNTLDLSSVAYVKQVSSLPVIVDPSHATGCKEIIGSMCLASIMSDADGVIVEVHSEPSQALSDANQALNPEEFACIKKKIDQTVPFYRKMMYEEEMLK